MGCRVPQIRRGARVILREQDVDFSLGVTSVLGLNGVGKTTLFANILGILQPMARSTIESGDSLAIPSQDRPKFMRAIGYLPQDVPALRSMSARDFVSYAAWLKGKSAPETDAMRCLARVNLEDDADTSMAKLSGGMRRRAGIAAALVHDPAVLLLDEPTAGLDPVERRRVQRLVTHLAQRRVVIVSTHLLEDARAMPGRICILGAGVLTQLDKTAGEASDDELIHLMQRGAQ